MIFMAYSSVSRSVWSSNKALHCCPKISDKCKTGWASNSESKAILLLSIVWLPSGSGWLQPPSSLSTKLDYQVPHKFTSERWVEDGMLVPLISPSLSAYSLRRAVPLTGSEVRGHISWGQGCWDTRQGCSDTATLLHQWISQTYQETCMLVSKTAIDPHSLPGWK